MRLTDRPRTLSEMKPDSHWPDELQHVMDKALSRDAKQRYQSASQFGRDFAHAVSNMPAGEHAEAGTQVIGAPVVPPTRIANASAVPVGATIPQSAVQASSPSPSSLAPSKSKMPMMAGGGVVAVLALVGILYGTGAIGSKKVVAAPNAVAPVTAGSPSVTPTSGAPSGNLKVSEAVPQGGTAAPQTPRRNSAAATIPSAPAASNGGTHASDLTSARHLAETDNDPVTAKQGVAAIDRLLPKLTDKSEIFEARYIRAVGMYNSNDEARACADIRSLVQDSAGEKDNSNINAFLATGACKGK